MKLNLQRVNGRGCPSHVGLWIRTNMDASVDTNVVSTARISCWPFTSRRVSNSNSNSSNSGNSSSASSPYLGSGSNGREATESN